MKFFNSKGFNGFDKKYILTVLGLLALAAAVFFLFFSISVSTLDKRITSELYSDVDKACGDMERYIQDDIKMLYAAASLAEENDDSYVLSRLREIKGSVDCYMLGLISKDGVFISTGGQSLDFDKENLLDDLFGGNAVSGRLIFTDGQGCFVSCVPIYYGSVITGGVCCIDKISDLYDSLLSNDALSLGLVDGNGTVLAGSLSESGNIGNVLSASSLEKYYNGISKGKSVFIKEKTDGSGIRLLAKPLEINGCTLIGTISDDDFKSIVIGFFYPVMFLCISFFGLSVLAVLLSVVYFKRANAGLISQLDRFSQSSRILGVSYIKHMPDRPGLISYYSSSLALQLGYDKGEIESLLGGSLEQLIYSADRSNAFRAFEELYSSEKSSGNISFRLEDKHRNIHWFSDYMTTDRKSGEIISLISPIDKMINLRSGIDIMAKRLDLLTRASSYYVFELNLRDMELYVSDNFKERMGYVITAEDCFKASVRERLISPHSRKELEAMIRSYRKGDKSIKGALTVIGAAGEFVRLNVEAEIIGSVINDDVRILAILNEIY